MKKKIPRYAHDAKATIMTGLGLSLKREKLHPKISEQILAQEKQESTYSNGFENIFYGINDQIVFHHPQRHLYKLHDVWVTGSEAHVFFDQKTLFSVCPATGDAAEKKIRRPISCFAKRQDSPVFILANRAPGNRAHFLFEHLPCLVIFFFRNSSIRRSRSYIADPFDRGERNSVACQSPRVSPATTA